MAASAPVRPAVMCSCWAPAAVSCTRIFSSVFSVLSSRKLQVGEGVLGSEKSFKNFRIFSFLKGVIVGDEEI